MSIEEEIAEVVKRYGWYAVAITDHSPSFVYSIGLMQTFDHPEFIIFGMEANEAHAVLCALIDEIGAGQLFATARVDALSVEGAVRRVGIRPVHPTQHPMFMGFAMGYCRHIGRIGELEAMQVFWPDNRDKLPFEPGCDQEVEKLQPRLDIGLSSEEVEELEQRWE